MPVAPESSDHTHMLGPQVTQVDKLCSLQWRMSSGMAWHAECCQICQSLRTLSPDLLLPGQDRRESLKDSFCPARLFLGYVLVAVLYIKEVAMKIMKLPYSCVNTEINRMKSNVMRPMPEATGQNACGVSPRGLDSCVYFARRHLGAVTFCKESF